MTIYGEISLTKEIFSGWEIQGISCYHKFLNKIHFLSSYDLINLTDKQYHIKKKTTYKSAPTPSVLPDRNKRT